MVVITPKHVATVLMYILIFFKRNYFAASVGNKILITLMVLWYLSQGANMSVVLHRDVSSPDSSCLSLPVGSPSWLTQRHGVCQTWRHTSTTRRKTFAAPSSNTVNENLTLAVPLGGDETSTLRKVGRKYLKSFEMWCWRRMENISWTDCVRNEGF
jgi:hypothetical protein